MTHALKCVCETSYQILVVVMFSNNKSDSVFVCQVTTYIQGVSGGTVNILGGGSMDYSE
jgi:hypothetical protein